MKAKKMLALTLALTVGIMAAGCGSSSGGGTQTTAAGGGQKETAQETKGAAGEKAADDTVYELKLAHIYAADHPFNIGVQQLVDEIGEKTGGHVKINVFPAAQLGAQTDEINNILAGSIDIAILGIGEVGKYVNDFNVYEAPYVFRDCDQAMRAVNSEIMAPYYDKVSENGFSILTSFYYGVRNLTCSKAVDSPADTSGMKIRVPDHTIPTYIAQYVFKANPTPMSLSEVYLALQQGVVDGQENPIPTIYAQKFYEVCDYINMTQHQITICPVIIGNTVLDKLPAEYAAVVEECFKEGTDTVNQLVLDAEEEQLQLMIKEGVQVHEPADRQAFVDAAAEVVKACESGGQWSEGLYGKLQAVE